MVHVTAHKRLFNGKVINVRHHNRNYNIKFVSPNTLKDYAGMNFWARKSFGFNRKMGKNDIWIDRNLSHRDKIETINHEIIEAELMRKGKDYFDSHLIALRKEKERRYI